MAADWLFKCVVYCGLVDRYSLAPLLAAGTVSSAYSIDLNGARSARWLAGSDRVIVIALL